MGAGNYYFNGPVSSDWHYMVYVDLRPRDWDTELQERQQAFDLHLRTDHQAAALLAQAEEDGNEEVIRKELKESWEALHYDIDDAESFAQDMADYQRQAVYDALAIHLKVDLDLEHCRRVSDAEVIATWDRFEILQANTYYGDRLALILTPDSDYTEVIGNLECGEFVYESNWRDHQRKLMNEENLRLARIKKSVESGSLHQDLHKHFVKLLWALREEGLASDMTFRGCAWTSIEFGQSNWAAKVEAHSKAHKRSALRNRVTAHQVLMLS